VQDKQNCFWSQYCGIWIYNCIIIIIIIIIINDNKQIGPFLLCAFFLLVVDIH